MTFRVLATQAEVNELILAELRANDRCQLVGPRASYLILSTNPVAVLSNHTSIISGGTHNVAKEIHNHSHFATGEGRKGEYDNPSIVLLAFMKLSTVLTTTRHRLTQQFYCPWRFPQFF